MVNDDTTPTNKTTPGAAPVPAPTPAPAAAASSLPVAWKVTFLLNTPDGLKRIMFSIEKDSNGSTSNWTVAFTLYTRTDPTVAYGDALVSLNVFLDPALAANVQQTANAGLTPSQASQATQAARAAQEVHEGKLTLPVFHSIISKIFK